LVQWSKVAPELKETRSLIAFINDHFVQTDASVTSLADTRNILTNARLRNYDLVTAIEVLGSGGPQTLPPLLKEAIHSNKAYTDEEAIGIVKNLDEAIRLRLACEEILPLPMMSYSIADGRACFRVPTLFEADLTLSGSTLEDRWWLLRVKFDFKVTGEGVDRFPRQPKKNQRLALLSIADAELAPRSVAAVPEQGGLDGVDKPSIADEEGVDVEMREADEPLALGDSEAIIRKDAPLVRLYNLLQSQALQYRLDILHFQALQQVKLSWGRQLSVRMEVNQYPRTLHITYWQRLDSDGSADGETWRPNASASLAISVQEKAKESGTENVLKRLSTTANNDNSEHGRGQIPERLHVNVQWNVQGPAANFLGSKGVSVDARDLNAERMLLDVTSRHLRAVIKAVKSRIELSSLGRMMSIQDCSRMSAKGFKDHYLQMTLSEKVTIALFIDQMSGRVRLEEASNVFNSSAMSNSTLAGHDWLKRLREASSRLNEKPDQIVHILQSLRSKVILEDLEEKSTMLGIPITTRMPLRQIDYNKLHAKPGALMYIALVQCPGYYLVIHIGDEAIRVALMCAGTFLEDLITSMRIISLEWLDWQRVVAAAPSLTHTQLGKRKLHEMDASSPPSLSISKENLSKLHSYSVALICYHKVEEQMRARGLSYIHVGGWTNVKPPPSSAEDVKEVDLVSDIIPSLSLNANTLLGSTNRQVTKRNISIRLHQWWNPSKAHVAFSIKLKLKKGLVSKKDISETNQEKIQFNSETGVLNFLIQNIDNCVAIFVSSWKHIEKILDLATEVTSRKQAGFFELKECDLIKVQFAYSMNLMGEVKWARDLTKQRGGYYDLIFTGQDNRKNPHQVMRSTLMNWLNREDDSSPVFWRRFLEVRNEVLFKQESTYLLLLFYFFIFSPQILQQMLPILEHVYTFPEVYYDSVDCPELQIQDAGHFRLVFLEEFILDVQLVKSNQILFSDGASLTRRSAGTKSNATTKTKDKDEFSLDEDEDIDGDKAPSQSLDTESPSTIPTLPTIFSALVSDFNQAHTDTTSVVLAFSNGLLCPNHQSTVDWFLPKIIERIQQALT